MMQKAMISFILAVAVIISDAFATTATTSFTVNATVQSACLVSASNLSFGNYSSVAVNQQSTITVTCTATSPYTVALNQGIYGTSTTARMMSNGGTGSGTKVNYSLFSNASRTQNWGIVVGTDTVAGVGTGSAQSLTVYGTIPGSQYPVASASFTDTITVTVNY